MRGKQSIPESIFTNLITFLFILFSISIVFPFVQQITISLSTPESIIKDSLYLFPKTPTLAAYETIARSFRVGQSLVFTVWKTVVGTALHLIIACLTAYPLSKRHLPFRKTFTSLLIFTMLFSGGLIPSFLLVRNLGLMNTIWALILPVLVSPFNIIILRNFFMAIPDSLEESARIDGASALRVLFRIVLPVSAPALATVTLWVLVAHWNSWFDAMLYITDSSKMVLQILLRRIRAMSPSAFGAGISDDIIAMRGRDSSTVSAESVNAAILMMVTLPIILTYPFLQRYVIKGILVGSVKE